MKYGELSLAGVVFILLVGMRYAPNGSTQESLPMVPDKTPVVTDNQIPTPAVWKALCKLNPDFGLNPDADKARQTIPQGAKDPDCIDDLPQDLIVSAIATVPDPVTTNLGLLTDRTIEAIQTSAAEAGYIPYLEALPWPIQKTTSMDSEKDQPNLSKKQSADQDNDVDGQYPGVLIFRTSESLESRRKYLTVFMVSETPTAGVDKEQTYAALRIIGKIPHRSGNAVRKVLLAGPFFSGSVASLEEIARKFRDSAEWETNSSDNNISSVRCLNAYSGTITNPGIEVRKMLDPICGPLLTEGQTRDGEALKLFTDWATDKKNGLGYRPTQIAFLSEEGTQYGKGTEETSKQQDRRASCPPDSTT